MERTLPSKKAPSVERLYREVFDLEGLTSEERRVIVRAYLSMCAFADSRVQIVLDAIDRLGIADRTIIIYQSDHGDFAGEHNCVEKWDTCFYECIVRVPLMIRLPGVIPAGGTCA